MDIRDLFEKVIGPYDFGDFQWDRDDVVYQFHNKRTSSNEFEILMKEAFSKYNFNFQYDNKGWFLNVESSDFNEVFESNNKWQVMIDSGLKLMQRDDEWKS